MKIRRVLFLGGAALALLVLYSLFSRGSEEGDFTAFETWSPTPAEIARAVGKGETGRFDDERHQQFARLFQKRFRDRQIAIGLRFKDENTLKVMCAALTPRWYMARVGVQAYHEAHNVFGRSYNVDIYETYISLRQKKVAEVRPIRDSARLLVNFDPRFEQAYNASLRRLTPEEIKARMKERLELERRMIQRYLPNSTNPQGSAAHH